MDWRRPATVMTLVIAAVASCAYVEPRATSVTEVRYTRSKWFCQQASSHFASGRPEPSLSDFTTQELLLWQELAAAPVTRRNMVFITHALSLWGHSQPCSGLGPHPDLGVTSMIDCTAARPEGSDEANKPSTGSSITVFSKSEVAYTASIKAEVAAWRPLAGSCYQAHINREGRDFAEGKVVVDFHVGDNGQVTYAHLVSSELSDSVAEECVRKIFCNLSLARRDVDVAYFKFPFVFSARPPGRSIRGSN